MKHFVPVSSFLLGIVLFFAMSFFSRSFKSDEIALGQNTSRHIGRLNGKIVTGISESIDSVIYFMREESKRSSGHHLALWMGNSQLHSINYYEPGNHLAVEYANTSLQHSIGHPTIFQFSSPHLNFVEELIYLSEVNTSGIKLDFLIIPITYRSFHFSTIRSELKTLAGYQNIEDFVEVDELKKIYQYEKESDERGKLLSKEKTLQDKSEEKIDALLTNHIPLYGFRENTKSFISFLPLQTIRFFSDKTKDLNIKGKDDIVELNMKALLTLLNYAKANNIKVILYQVPHPQDPAFFFYNKPAYLSFFSEVKGIAQTYSNVTFLDLSEIVALDFWGISNDGYKDTYHFKDRGHQLLGDTIANSIKSIIK